jgi:hypothetical protein
MRAVNSPAKILLKTTEVSRKRAVTPTAVTVG